MHSADTTARLEALWVAMDCVYDRINNMDSATQLDEVTKLYRIVQILEEISAAEAKRSYDISV